MAFYLLIAEGDDPATSEALLALSDTAVIRGVVDLIARRLGVVPTTLKPLRGPSSPRGDAGLADTQGCPITSPPNRGPGQMP